MINLDFSIDSYCQSLQVIEPAAFTFVTTVNTIAEHMQPRNYTEASDGYPHVPGVLL